MSRKTFRLSYDDFKIRYYANTDTDTNDWTGVGLNVKQNN